MAIKAIMLRKRIELKKAELAQRRERAKEFETRKSDITEAIGEATTEEEIDALNEGMDQLETEWKEHEETENRLSGEIAALEQQLTEEEQRGTPPINNPESGANTERSNHMTTTINIRSLPFGQRVMDALPRQERDAIIGQEDSKNFLAQLRSLKGEKRGVSGGELTIPVVFLDLIAENMYRYSKLLNRVRVRSVTGTTRQTIAGTVPEAVWTEMCAAINELTLVFNQTTLDGYKVAGFVPVCNSLLEDNDVNLASWIVEMLSESIGLAIDKAILYGKGAANSMPLGVVTRLAQQSKPAGYPAAAPAWVDLHTSNILKIDASKTGAEFWAALQIAAGATFTRYSRGNQFWAMNSKTYALLKSKAITFTASGDVVANVYGILPIVTGDIDILEFIPDGDIIGGYGDLYLYADRARMTIEESREVQFLQDNTVFKGKARADGTPVVPGAFVAININGSEVTTAMTFAADTANDADLDSLSVGTGSLSPAFDAATQSYTLSTTAASLAVNAAAAQIDAKVAISYGGKNVANGGNITPTAGASTLTVTVTNGNATKVYTVAITKT